MCATVTSASWLASLASPTAAQRAFGRLCWLPAVLGTPSNVEVSERPAAAEAAPGGFRCSARAGRTPAMISRACCAFVPLMTPTCVPWRAQAVYRRARAADIARWRCAPRATARRGKWQVSSLGVLGRVRERAHPAGRRENEQRRAGVHARQFPGLPQVGARSGTTFQCTPRRNPKDKKKAGLASPSRSSGAPHSGQAKGNTQGRKQWQHSGDSRKAVSPFLLSVVISRKTTCPCEQVTRKCGHTKLPSPAQYSTPRGRGAKEPQPSHSSEKCRLVDTTSESPLPASVSNGCLWIRKTKTAASEAGRHGSRVFSSVAILSALLTIFADHVPLLLSPSHNL